MPDLQPESSSPARPTLSHELNTAEDGIALTEPHSEPKTTPAHLRLYVAILALAPFLFIAACVALIRSSFFARHDQNVYLANIGYGATLHNADCQVLLYGDSSALVGVDPATVQRATGLSTCNIAEFAGMTMINGTMIVDDYLRHNARPRYLIFLYAPENLAPYPKWKFVGFFEALFFRIRQGLDPGLLRLLLFHGEEVLSTAEMSGRFALTWATHKSLPPELLHNREINRGRLDAPGAALTECGSVARIHPPSRAWTDNLRSRYGIDGTSVLVDVTPVPVCDPGLPIYRAELVSEPGIVDNQLHTYPVGWYNGTNRLHMTPDGIAALSAEIAAQVNQATAGENR